MSENGSVKFGRRLAAVCASALILNAVPAQRPTGASFDGDVDYAAVIERARCAPSLIATEEMVRVARSRIVSEAEAGQWWSGFRKDVDRRIRTCPAIPPVGAQWYHWYACSACGVQLEGESPKRHRCPTCGKVYSGWPYDESYYFSVHHELAKLAMDCGVAWLLSGERRYADKTRDILCGYAQCYLSYPLHDNNGPTGKNRDAARAFSQMLDESVWLLDLVRGYDAVATALDPEEKTAVLEKLIRPAADLIYACDRIGMHKLGNHRCWHLSAYALAALVLGDVDRLRESKEGLSGCDYQLAHGILSDGCWYEGSWLYHFYTMGSLMPYFTALDNLGVRPPACFKSLFDAPFGEVTPDGKLPALNDSGRIDFANGPNERFYEQAWTWWRDDVYARWLSRRSRSSLHGVLYGSPLPEKMAAEQPRSKVYDAIGVAVLRSRGASGGNYLLMDFGPHTGWHGHYDKLNLLVWANGEMFAEDPGCVGYGLPLHWGWYKRSLAHNTLSVDGDQGRADGKLLGFGERNGVQYVIADAGVVARGVQVRRATTLWGDLVFDFVRAESDDNHLYEWTFHSRGTLKTSVRGEPVRLSRPEIVCKTRGDAEEKGPRTDAWAWTSDCREGTHDGRWNAKWTLPSGNALALFQRSQPGTLRSAAGGAQPPSESLRVTANRIRAKSAAFATVLALDGRDDVVIEPPCETEGGSFCVRSGGRRLRFTLADDWTSLDVCAVE